MRGALEPAVRRLPAGADKSSCTEVAVNRDELDADIRTVTHLATYVQKLQDGARELVAQIRPQQRGYSTPQEDNQMRALLVSYCQVRNALLELIETLRLRSEEDKDAYPVIFLTGFSAALVLVDAARFLREMVEHRDVVRERLNAAAPEFGIPAGVYDQVQRSLLNPRHAWHLYHAISYLDAHESDLRELALRPDLRPLMAIIDRLRHRLDVTLATYSEARIRKRGKQVVSLVRDDLLKRALVGMQKLGCLLVTDRYAKRGHSPALPESIVHGLRSELAPGDILVVRKEYALTNYFLPGYWPHAALYLGDRQQLRALGDPPQRLRSGWDQLLASDETGPRVLEALKDGVRVRGLDSPLRSDSIVVLRPQLQLTELVEGLARGLVHQGKAYDFDFDLKRSNCLVCTEIVYRSFDGLGNIRFALQQRAGRATLSGADLIAMALHGEHLDVHAAYNAPFSERLEIGDTAIALTRQFHSAPDPTGDVPQG
ncbi:MAG: hypothetical protein CMJ59_13570 [Planctomycetaceae bacterium]|nr:hypothetical protein [Planctomycetaceae bacterium]